MREDMPHEPRSELQASEDERSKHPVTGFEAWTRGGLTGISTLRVAPPWVLALTLVFVVALVLALGAWRSGPVRGALVFVGLWGIVLLFLRTWLIATARARNYLVTRTDWSDAARLAIIGALVLLVPIVAGVVAYVGITLLGMLGR